MAHRHVRLCLGLGIALRVLVFVFQSPFDKDQHFAVVQYMFRTGTIPIATQLDQAYQPPLYYLLAAPLLFRGVAKVVQGLSLGLSLVTLLVGSSLLTRLKLPPQAHRAALLLLCCLPQLIMFQNVISNDTLAICLGTLVLLQTHRYLWAPQWTQRLLLALLLGLGLLTKATFLAFLLPVGLVVLLTERRQGMSAWQMGRALSGCLLLIGALGSYKFLQSYYYLGNPFFCNLDVPNLWVQEHQQAYQGLASWRDMNLLTLVQSPTVTEQTKHAYPLVLYGSLWYQFIPESNFTGNLTGFRVLGSVIYLVAVIPTAIAILGCMSLGLSARRLIHLRPCSQAAWTQHVFPAAAALCVLMNLALLVWAGLKYEDWSIFQARLLFPSILGMLVCFTAGLRLLERALRLTRGVHAALHLLIVLFLLYFVVEIAICPPSAASAGWRTTRGAHGPPAHLMSVPP